MPRLSHPAHTAPSTCQTHRTLSWISVLASQPIYIGSDTSSGFPLSQVVVFCMVVELKGGGASVSPRGRVAGGEASPRRSRACHSKDLRKLSALSSRLFPFPFVELLCVLVDVLEVPMQMSPLLGELADHQEKQVLLAAGCTALDPSLVLGSPRPGFSLPGLPSFHLEVLPP